MGAAWVAIGATLVVAPSHAQTERAAAPVVEPTPEAREANARALELSRARDFAGALESFQRAYDLSPSYLILYNIAKMSEATRDVARAVDAFERYLSEGGELVEAERRAEVEKSLEELRPRIGRLRVDVDESAAEVEVDGRSRGRTPLPMPIWLNPGEHRVLIIGTRTVSRRVKVEPGRVEELAVSMKPTARLAPQTTTDGIPVGWRTSAWIGTGVLAVGATVTGTLALVLDADLEDDVYVGPARRPPEDSDIAAKAARLDGLAAATDVLVVAGVVTGATAISLTVIDAVLSGGDDAPASGGGTLDLRWSPLGLSVVGRF